MNINEHGPSSVSGDGDRCIWHAPTSPFLSKEEALPACKNLLHEICYGPEGTELIEYLNVLQGKAYEKPC